MREDLLRELETEYERQRLENERTERLRQEEIGRKFPEISALNQERLSLITGTLRGILRGEAGVDDLPEKMEILSQRIREALVKEGYPADYLAPVSKCTICGDTGYVGETLRVPCECLRKNYQGKLRKKIGLPENDRETFEYFRTDIGSETPLPGSRYSQRDLMGFARKNCESWADHYPDVHLRNMLLTGKSGLGKTFLLRAMAARLLQRGIPVLLISAYEFLETARKDYFGNDSGEMDELLNTEVLMLDDIGSEPMVQNITIEQLFRLVNQRLNRCLPLLISTNLNLEEFRERYTERIASRMTDPHQCQVVPLMGDDLRSV